MCCDLESPSWFPPYLPFISHTSSPSTLPLWVFASASVASGSLDLLSPLSGNLFLQIVRQFTLWSLSDVCSAVSLLVTLLKISAHLFLPLLPAHFLFYFFLCISSRFITIWLLYDYMCVYVYIFTYNLFLNPRIMKTGATSLFLKQSLADRRPL